MAEMKQIYDFAVKWLDKFLDQKIHYIELVDHYMADDCDALGFEMDCGKAFSKRYGKAFNDCEELGRIIDDVNDIELLGSAIFSQWRYFNHWAYTGEEILKFKNRSWFILALSRLATLSGENPYIFKKIKQEIMADAMNKSYTRKGIPPLFKASINARIVIVGQAPGRKAEETQLFWNDLSGDRLREWMGVSREEFYETDRIAQLPMDFYYPGKAKHGDLPPRKGFAEKWHPQLMEEMPNVETIFLIGNYAQKHYLGKRREKNLTETVRNFKNYLPRYLPLVHPSPLNIGWFKRNPWFGSEVLPVLKEIVRTSLKKDI